MDNIIKLNVPNKYIDKSMTDLIIGSKELGAFISSVIENSNEKEINLFIDKINNLISQNSHLSVNSIIMSFLSV